MKGEQYKRITKMIFDKREQSFQRKLNYKVTFSLSLGNIRNEHHGLYEYLSDYDSIDDEKHSVIYNTNEIRLNESDYLDKDEREESADLSDKENSSANKNALLEINESKNVNNNDDPLDVFFQATEPENGLPIWELMSWFPIIVNGVCRFIGKLRSPRSPRMVGIVTEAILDYNDSVIITVNSRYRLTGDMDTTYLPTNITDSLPTLSHNDWLKNAVILSKMAVFGKKSLINTKPRNLSHGRLINHMISQLSTTKLHKVLTSKHMATSESGDTIIMSHLDDILHKCQTGPDWLNEFREFLTKYGQNITIAEDMFDGDTTLNVNQLRSVDMDEPSNYDDFLQQGDIFNSTINSSTENLYLWTVVKNSDSKFCVTGLVRTDKSYREVVASPIKSVSSEGTFVVTEKERYLLMGPLYSLAIHSSYSTTDNSSYLEVFQKYFPRGLPKNWKILVTLMDIILSKCTQLKRNIVKVTELDKPDKEKSPSFESTNEVVDVTSSPTKSKKKISKIKKLKIKKSKIKKPKIKKPTIKKPIKDQLIKSVETRGRKRKQLNEDNETTITKNKKDAKRRKTSYNVCHTPSIFLSHHKSSFKTPVVPRKSLIIQDRTIEAHCSLIYQPTIGYPVDLSKIPITRSGRMSLPPPDMLTFSRFEKVGNSVHFISDSVTKMVFKR